MSAKKVSLHIGTPKTGTSFVQDLLFQSRGVLAEQGVLYPAERFDGQFLAALDLLELRWGGLERHAIGAWDRLAEQVRDWEGHVIVSHEILASASALHVKKALDSFGDAEVHLVLSARDLVRQVPAEWQENVKHRRTVTYARFLDAVAADPPQGEVATWFWAVQDVPWILRRWGQGIPPERVHLVTVPKSGAAPTELWDRFARAFDLEAAGLDPADSERLNPSLGVAETELVRMINEKVNGVLVGDHYREFVRELLAHRTLSRQERSDRLVLPARHRTWVVERATRWVDELAAAGYDVVGDLAELLPEPEDTAPFVDPDALTSEQREAAAMTAIVTLLRQAGDLREEVNGLREEVREAWEQRDAALREAGVVTRTKRAVVRRADHSRAVSAALAGYRALRRR